MCDSDLCIVTATSKKTKNEGFLTRGRVGDPIHLQDEVVFEENVADDGEQVDEDESQHGREHDGAPVTCHALDDVQQSLFSVDQVEQLQSRAAKKQTHVRKTRNDIMSL